MCFSAPVSFVTSAALVAAGAGSMKHAKGKMRLAAAIPFIFATQQFIEGFQWIVDKPSFVSSLLGYAFIFFAFLVWPVYLPLTAYLNERDLKRKSILKVFLGLGALISTWLLVVLFSNPLGVEMFEKSIYYNIDFSYLTLTALSYVFVVVVSLCLSTTPRFRWFGILLFVSFIFSYLIFYLAFISVWCFFAAALSGLIYFYFSKNVKSH